jgi:hypothetical protein
MGDDLGNLARFDAVIEREVEIAGHLDRLVARNQGANGDDAAVPPGLTPTLELPKAATPHAARAGRGSLAASAKALGGDSGTAWRGLGSPAAKASTNCVSRKARWNSSDFGLRPLAIPCPVSSGLGVKWFPWLVSCNADRGCVGRSPIG